MTFLWRSMSPKFHKFLERSLAHKIHKDSIKIIGQSSHFGTTSSRTLVYALWIFRLQQNFKNPFFQNGSSNQHPRCHHASWLWDYLSTLHDGYHYVLLTPWPYLHLLTLFHLDLTFDSPGGEAVNNTSPTPNQDSLSEDVLLPLTNTRPPSSSEEECRSSDDDSDYSLPTLTPNRDTVPFAAVHPASEALQDPLPVEAPSPSEDTSPLTLVADGPLTLEALRAFPLVKHILNFKVGGKPKYIRGYTLVPPHSTEGWAFLLFETINDFSHHLFDCLHYQDLLAKALALDMMSLIVRCSTTRKPDWIYKSLRSVSVAYHKMELRELYIALSKVFKKKKKDYFHILDSWKKLQVFSTIEGLRL